MRIAFSAAVVALALVAGNAAAQTPDASGRRDFLASCASCHGTDGSGNGPVAAALRQRPADLTGIALANNGVFPSARVRRVIDGRDVAAHGTPDMPVWGSVFRGGEQAVRARIDALVAYVESIQRKRGQ
jgi:mono/diheme cytochrome c family protein